MWGLYVYYALVLEQESRMSGGMEEMGRDEAVTFDVVEFPNHYQLFGNLEVIDAIKELLTEEEFRGYLKGNVLKYRLRAGKKDNIAQDIKKALKYEGWLNK